MALVIGHSEFPLIFRAVIVTVADEGSLPVVVEIRVGDRDIVRSVSDIKKTIIIILMFHTNQ